MSHPAAYLYPDWRYVGSFPLSELPDVSIGNHDHTPSSFTTSYRSEGGLKVGASVRSRIQGVRPNPRKTGRNEYRRVRKLTGADREKTITALKETRRCGSNHKSSHGCDLNQDGKCQFMVRWVQTFDDLDVVHVYQKGSHGPSFRLNPRLLKIAPHIRQRILESDGLDFGTGGRTTPTTEVVRYQERWGGDTSDEIPAPHLVPSLRQVQNV